MPKSLDVTLTFEDNIPVPVIGQRVRSGSIADQVRKMQIGQSVFLTEKSHVLSFSAAVKKHRTDCRVATQTEKKDGVTGTRCWLADGIISSSAELSNAAAK